jgi:hypothetical protein
LGAEAGSAPFGKSVFSLVISVRISSIASPYAASAWIHQNSDGRTLAASDRHSSHSRHSREFLRHADVGQILDLRQRQGFEVTAKEITGVSAGLGQIVQKGDFLAQIDPRRDGDTPGKGALVIVEP